MYYLLFIIYYLILKTKKMNGFSRLLFTTITIYGNKILTFECSYIYSICIVFFLCHFLFFPFLPHILWLFFPLYY